MMATIVFQRTGRCKPSLLRTLYEGRKAPRGGRRSLLSLRTIERRLYRFSFGCITDAPSSKGTAQGVAVGKRGYRWRRIVRG